MRLRNNTSGMNRLKGRVPDALSGSQLWHHTEKAKKLIDGRRCVECGGFLSRYNKQTSCWSHDYEEAG